MNKSLLTNLLAGLGIIIGYFWPSEILFSVGMFALSGAITNWLAIYMLFEKVPGLYGSGVIPLRFEAFKTAISKLMMEQFFTKENINRFLGTATAAEQQLDFTPLINKLDLAPAFDALAETVEQSSLGGMLAMFGGQEALQPLKQPFIDKMKLSLSDIASGEAFNQLLQQEVFKLDLQEDIQLKIQKIVTQRLDELTPQMVKQMVQQIIKEHLSWLVVWGGVFGGLIGLITAVLQNQYI